eukprot:TRINITY_DN3429_c0_g1_i1.p1 TRINITY_DN3429_c0_g1~~TRINITY_DN3429_c0_g1_i1.p1  ORF type:complete len:1198 (+),score=311.34 TRINITY_DN3429_c0_g1_i1:9-3602(+)
MEQTQQDQQQAPEKSEIETPVPQNNGEEQAPTTTTTAEEEELSSFTIFVKTPTGTLIQLQVSKLDSVHDIKQYLLEAKEICYLTSYNLQIGDRILNDLLELSEIPELEANTTLLITEAPYNDLTSRLHVRRLRDLLGTSEIDLPGSPALFSIVSSSIPDDANLHGHVLEDLKKKLELFNPKSTRNTANLSFIIPRRSKNLVNCVKSICFSGWNPPPGYRRLQGDLYYLEIITNENKFFHVTASTKGFFANSTSDSTFDPSPAAKSFESHNLVGLLNQISTGFKKNFVSLLKTRFELHPFELLGIQQPILPWADHLDLHTFDLNRSEDALLRTSEIDHVRGQLRDWNEEYQASKELPSETVQDRVMRDRALNKVTLDFVESATKGAIAVVNKTVPPLNPLDPERIHMFIYNNIFFTFNLDGRDATETGGERFAYTGANNDLKGVTAVNHADVMGLCTLLTSIITYRGHRVIAQSLVPGILQRDPSNILYGSIDKGKTIFSDPEFHKLVANVADKLHVSESLLSDEQGNKVPLFVPKDCKGITGTDGRRYLLDFIRTTPRDSNYKDESAILRPELLAHYLNEYREKNKEVENPPKLLFNLNALSSSKLEISEEQKNNEETLIKDAAKFLKETVIPHLIKEFSISVLPVDGVSLTRIMHQRGVNMRYLGYIANLPDIPAYIKDICVEEMVTRVAKHVINSSLRETEEHNLSNQISLLFNAILGTQTPQATPISDQAVPTTTQEVKPVQPAQNATGLTGSAQRPTAQKSKKKKSKSATGTGSASASASTPTTNIVSTPQQDVAAEAVKIWEEIRKQVKERFEYELPEKVVIRQVSALRGLCLKLGVQVAAISYNFLSSTPIRPQDVLDIFPIVRYASPRASDGSELLEAGKAFYLQGRLDIAFDLLNEAMNILYQVYGPMHPRTADCYGNLAMVLYNAGDIAQGLIHQTKAVIINERVLGVDHQDTYHSYGNIGMIYHSLHKSEQALNFLYRALSLGQIVAGLLHPDNSSITITIAMILQDLGEHKLSLRFLKMALKSQELHYGPDHLQIAATCHQIAIAYNLIDKFKKALEFEKRNYLILQKTLGESDLRTVESNIWLKQFIAKAVQVERENVKQQQQKQQQQQKPTPAVLGNSNSVAGIAAELRRVSKPGQQAANKNIKTPLRPGLNSINGKPVNDVMAYINGSKATGSPSASPAKRKK